MSDTSKTDELTHRLARLEVLYREEQSRRAKVALEQSAIKQSLFHGRMTEEKVLARIEALETALNSSVVGHG